MTLNKTEKAKIQIKIRRYILANGLLYLLHLLRKPHDFDHSQWP